MADALTVHARRDAGLLLDRLQEPVLSEYTCNVIRKCNTKIDLMCPFVVLLVVCRVLLLADDLTGCPVFIGSQAGFWQVDTLPSSGLFK